MPESAAAADAVLLAGLAATDPAFATILAAASRALALLGADHDGALFDTEPSHRVRALAQGAAR